MTVEASSRELFGSISPAEFFYRNKQMAGFSNPTQAVYTVVRELVENSLDACDIAEVAPDIGVSISSSASDVVTISVSDNGTGVPHEQVPESFGKILYGSKYSSRQRRGTFGLGVTMAILYGQITTDSPAVIHTRPPGHSAREYRIYIDVEQNEPIVESYEQKDRLYEGTTVSIRLRGDVLRAKDRVTEYLRLSTIGTPHAKIAFSMPEEIHATFGPHTELLPPTPKDSKPHPRSADTELLRRIIKSSPNKSVKKLLVEAFQQLGDKKATQVLKFMNLNQRTLASNLSRKEVSKLSDVLKKFEGFRAPDGSCLSPIGEQSFVQSLQSSHSCKIIGYATTDTSEWEGFPYVIESVLVLSDGFTPGGIPTLMRFANRVPLLYDPTEDVFSKTIQQVNWSSYGLNSSMKAAVYLHFCSTRVPYKAAGKQSIASTGDISRKAHNLFQELGRSLRKKLRKKAHAGRTKKRIRQFQSSFDIIVDSAASLAEIDDVPSSKDIIDSLFEV